MNSYILLRNNKESGSLSREDLQKIGLKSSDLIWVECQSVNWRHPHEIPELKSLVSEGSNQVADYEINQSAVINKQSHERDSEKITEKKLVIAELPANMTSIKKQGETDLFTGLDSTDIYKYAGISASVKPAIEKDSVDINTKYSRPLNEIKEMYVRNMEEKGKQKKSVPEIRLPKQVKKIIVYAGLVIAGGLIMLFIKNTDHKKHSTFAKQNIQQPAANKISADTISAQPNTIQEVSNEQYIIPDEEISVLPAEGKRSTVSVKKSSVEGKKIDNSADQEIKKAATEKRPVVNEVKEAKPVSSENISSMVSIRANDYGVGSFGGIRNLEMTLQNDSKYILDKVTVELRYLNPEGIILKTEDIHFEMIQPGAQETVAVKKSRRGVKVAYKITKIESKEVSSNTAGL